MTANGKPKSATGRSRKLRLKRESLKELDARRGAGKVKGGGATVVVGAICGPTQGCATAAYTNCNLSCVAACGGGGFKIG
jgi:hypothetical protein